MKAGRTRISLLGSGVVTPCGNSVEGILDVIEGRQPAPEPELKSGVDKGKKYPVLQVPTGECPRAGRYLRLRRASKISHFAMEAALLAFEDAGICFGGLAEKSILLVFAASDGGVIYTRRFFEGVIENGTGGGSPLLFPETVYNAPPSHVSASLGLRGHSLSLVGDSTAVVQACHVAARSLQSGECELAVVLAAEEWDPVVSEGYAEWGIAAMESRTRRVARRAVFSEGAGALVLAKSGGAIHLDAGPVIHGRLPVERLPPDNPRCVCSAISPSAARLLLPNTPLPESGTFFPRQILGEALCASTIWEIAIAARLAPAVCFVAGYNQNRSAVTLFPA